MSEACGRRGTHGVGSKKQKGRAVYYSGVNVMEKGRGLSRGLNNRLDIPPEDASPDQVLAEPPCRVRTLVIQVSHHPFPSNSLTYNAAVTAAYPCHALFLCESE